MDQQPKTASHRRAKLAAPLFAQEEMYREMNKTNGYWAGSVAPEAVWHTDLYKYSSRCRTSYSRRIISCSHR